LGKTLLSVHEERRRIAERMREGSLRLDARFLMDSYFAVLRERDDMERELFAFKHAARAHAEQPRGADA
jgi:hypothetical protein